jgi:replicative DNA helicase
VSVTEIAPRNDDFERTPPHDVAAEQCVLGGMLLSKDAISDVIEVIRPADHYRPAHQLIHEAILDLYARGEPADAITVANELTRRAEITRVGGAPYLHTLIASVPTAANAGYYARIVRERAILRRLVEAGTRIVQFGYAGDADADELVDRAQAEVFAVTERRASEDYQSLSEIMPGALDEIEAIGSRGGALTGVPTGFADLDVLTNGLHPGQMIVIAARPAMGKSTLALDFARAAAIRNSMATVLFSLEMGRNEITMRLLSAEARVPLQTMRTGQMNDDDWARLARRMSEVADAPLFIDDSPNMSLMEIRAKCRRLKQRNDLKFVIVDYLQLMSSPRRVENRQQEVSDMSRSLKLLAKELDVPVVALSQLNRGPEQRTDKKPLLSDLRESGCMTEDTTLLRADTGAPVTFGELMRDGWEGVLVWSLDERHRLVPAPVTKVFESGVKDVYRLRLASGREVKASANHPFLTFSGWTALENLRTGDRLAIPRYLPEPVNGRRGIVDELSAALDGRTVNTNTDTIPIDVWELVKAERTRAGLTERQFQAGIGTHYCGTTLYKSCPSRERLMRCAQVLGSDALREIASSDVYWDRVTSIEPLGPQPVYDATVKGTHNFVADGIAAHNSIEQDSDVVILLHREDAYERESPRAGEADLIVAKHRNGPTATVTVAFQGHYSRFVDMAPG